MGNILVRETPLRTLKFYEYPSFKSHGVLCSIIDFSLSAYDHSQEHHSRDLNEDQWIFQGDSSSDPQFQVYRDMLQEVKGDWEGKCYRTNVLWFAYLMEKLATRSTSKAFQKELLTAFSRIRGYQSVSESVRGDPFFTLRK